MSYVDSLTLANGLVTGYHKSDPPGTYALAIGNTLSGGTNGGVLMISGGGLSYWAPAPASGKYLRSSGTQWQPDTIHAQEVVYSMMQDVSAASKLLGRGDSGSGSPQEITLGAGLSMSGTTLSTSDAYTAGTAGDWNGGAPTTITSALDRCAALLKTLNAGTGP